MLLILDLIVPKGMAVSLDISLWLLPSKKFIFSNFCSSSLNADSITSISSSASFNSFSAAFFVYVAVNMSMVLGLLPIVGAPLPILSYGGSSMLAMMFGLGIVMSCNVYKNNAVG